MLRKLFENILDEKLQPSPEQQKFSPVTPPTVPFPSVHEEVQPLLVTETPIVDTVFCKI